MDNVKILGLPASAQDEQSARAFLERMRWPNGPVCAHCKSTEIYRLTQQADAKKSARVGLLKCKKCRKQFSVTVGTIFEGSHIPLHKWLMAIHFVCASKKGMSALQLSRMLGVTYKTAWFMCHRIRLAMKKMPLIKKLEGIVEVDETYIGGKDKRGFGNTGFNKKSPVMVLVQRNGELRSKPIKRLSAMELKKEIRANVSIASTIMTDEHASYKGLDREFVGGHKVVNHSKKEYVRGNVYTNTAESYFALLKRGVHGTFHHVSRKHLGRYCDEFSFRWNTRKVTDSERAEAMLKQIEGKRLLYKQPVNKQ
jgi:transposase-like protein